MSAQESFDHIDALVISPNTAMRWLDCSRETFYKLLNSGAFESYNEGRSRKIIAASVRAHIERRLAAARAERAA